MRVIAGLLGAILIASCSSERNEPNVMRVGAGTEAQDLDPHVVTGMTEHRMLTSIFEGLADVEPATLQAIPGAAESWTLSEDGRVYTFKIRKSAKWSNGDPLTAEDFVFSWERMLNPELAAEYGYFLHLLKNGKPYNEGKLTDFAQVGVKALDAKTLEVTLENPTSYFLNSQMHQAWFPVHPPTILKHEGLRKRGTRWTRAENIVSNGPFMVTEWRHNDMLRVRRNPHYWDAANIKYNGIDFYPIDNELTEERAFRSGDLHMTHTVPLHKIEVYKREQPEVVHTDPYVGVYFYRFNVSRPPFDDARVRQAFSMAFDREAMAANVLKGGEPAAYHFTPPDTAGYTSRAKVQYDPERAKQLLAEAGFPDGKGFPEVSILYNSSDSHQVIAEAIQQMWRQSLGVQVRLSNQDWKVYLDSMNNLNFDMARSAWICDVLDPVNFLECFLTGGGNNRTGYSSAEFDALISQSYATPDNAQRMELLQQAEEILLRDLPLMPIYFYTWKFLLAPEVKGFVTNPQGYIRWKDLWLEEEK